ncbi:hypothetical protein JTE90_002807 [Oedothorax gibbosus]|uniref:Glycosyl hydrolase family 13 catalytic domain-containing protein n=1 Tax=Oedothorax gibbosus TaxID=931172 RepID=A0AAV6UGK3_9ARAC|nr:hypothetical protein JTE90_002807 [Oedothorax gibbosus]
MSSLPTLDDLQARARQPPGCHPEKKSQQQTIPVVVTPTTIIQEREARQSTTQKIYRKCATVFQCSRSKTELPTYSQLHRGSTGSSLLSVASNFPEPWRRRVVLLVVAVVVSTMVFWAVLFWKMQHAQSTSDYQKDYERRPGHSWYRDAMFYEIFPASFQDTDSDGYGDFKGIIQHLDYIVHLGAKAIRLNSIFSALDYPLEYEHVIDLRTHDPHLGRGSWDFGLLVREAHGRGLRVVLEFNPCVTSDQHTWALHWQRGIPGYEHFYASHNSSKAAPEIENSEGPPPEDWELTQRTFGGHYIVNWSNPLVQEEYRKALVHWIELGVDGIYMKHLENMHVINKKDILGIIQQWRKVLDKPKRPGQLWSSRRHQTILEDCDSTTDQKTSVENTEKELLDSTYPTKALYQETSSNRDSEKDSIGVSDLSNILQKDKDPKKTDHTSSQCLGKMILIVSSKFADELTKRFGKESETLKTILKNIDVLDHPILVGSGEEMGQQVSSLGQLSSWQEFGSPVPMFHLGSSDTFRVASRIEPRYQMAAFYLLMSLPGATSVFYGDEIGMKDSFDVANGRNPHFECLVCIRSGSVYPSNKRNSAFEKIPLFDMFVPPGLDELPGSLAFLGHVGEAA